MRKKHTAKLSDALEELYSFETCYMATLEISDMPEIQFNINIKKCTHTHTLYFYVEMNWSLYSVPITNLFRDSLREKQLCGHTSIQYNFMISCKNNH